MRHVFLVLLLAALPASASAQVMPRPDDAVSLSLSAEGWVTTRTARTVIMVNAAVSSETAGKTRAAMLKAVRKLAPDAEWRLISFHRSQDKSGLENWRTRFEARLPEKALGGLGERTQKASRAGMKLSVSTVDFTPTLAETEAARAALRQNIMRQATSELKAVNEAFPGRHFRVMQIAFGGAKIRPGNPRTAMMKAEAAMDYAAAAPVPMPMSRGGDLQTARKITLSAQVTFAALPPENVKE